MLPPAPCPARTPAPPLAEPCAPEPQVSHVVAHYFATSEISDPRPARSVSPPPLPSCNFLTARSVKNQKSLEGWTRTTDRPDYSRVLYQLSYCQFPGPPARLRRHPDGGVAQCPPFPRGAFWRVLSRFCAAHVSLKPKQKVIHSRFLRVILDPGAMLIFSVSFQFLRMMPKHSDPSPPEPLTPGRRLPRVITVMVARSSTPRKIAQWLRGASQSGALVEVFN